MTNYLLKHRFITFNFKEELIFKGENGITRILDNQVETVIPEFENGLYYSKGLLIKSNANWTINGKYTSVDKEYYPSVGVDKLKLQVGILGHIFKYARNLEYEPLIVGK